jgi:thiol:disulfide interchange protein DsbD
MSFETEKRPLKHLLSLVFVFLLLGGFSAAAQDMPAKAEHYANFRVLAERSTIKAGEEVTVAVEQSIAPDWHSYWVNPGDSGSAPRHKWTMPDGFEIGPIQWPVPHKLPYGPLLNYGYEKNVILLQTLKAPDTLPEGALAFKVDVEVLVCKDICIPEYASLDLLLNNPANSDENNTDFFNQARAALPQTSDWPASFRDQGGDFILQIETPAGFSEGIKPETLEFLPLDWGLVANAAPASVNFDNGVVSVSQKRDSRDISGLDSVSGLLAYEDKTGRRQGFEIRAVRAQPSVAAQTNAANETADTGLLKALLLAIAGGLILNLMPCVFPVLSLKALSLVKISQKDAALARLHGLSYTAGVIFSFLAIAGALIALQLGGAEIGWGFQLQNPVVVAVLAYLLFVIGLNLSGVFELGNVFGNTGSKLASGNGLSASFFTGVLATIVATPCTAPFMGVAIGYALLQPPLVSLLIFAALGFGLALPYLMLAFVPALQKFLPRPGAWMDVFKQFLAFPMFGFAVWLVWIVAQQAGNFGLFGVLLGMVAIAFALWLLRHQPKNKNARLFVTVLALVSFALAIALLPFRVMPDDAVVSNAAEQNSEVFGENFTPEKLSEALAGADPIFVEMTAAWCITCKVNHATSINIDSTKKLFAEKRIRYLIGDWTNYDPAITQYLKSFGRNGVPIYVFYGAPDEGGQRPEPQVLPQILTPSILAKGVAP